MVNDDVDGELLEQGRELFRDLGVNNPEPGETYDIPVGDSAEFQVLESDIEDVTPRYREIANSLPRRGNERIINTGYARPLCNILGCNTLSLIPGTCSKTVEDFIDPQISIDNKPKRIPNAEVQLNALPGGQPPLIQGEVQIDGSNFSEPGEVIEKTEYKCSSETEEEKEIIDESAIVSMDSSHNIVVDSAEEVLDTVQGVIPGVSPDVTENTEVSFRKEGRISLIRGVAEVLATGSMTANVTGTVDVEYEWRDSTNTKTFEVDTRAVVPVDNLEGSF